MNFFSKVHNIRYSLTPFVLGVIFVLLIPNISHGLDIQNLDYEIDDQVISRISEHTISFQSASPINAGNSVSIAFPSEFIFSSPSIQSDAEVRINGVLLGVSDWSFNQSSNTVFITFQTTAPAGSIVDITLREDIGLVNPSITNPYIINFGVNASFAVSAEVWIFPAQSINVSAVVLGAPVIVGGGSGSGSGSSECRNCFFNESEPSFDNKGIIVSFKGFGSPYGFTQLFVNGSFVGSSEMDSDGLFLASVDNLGKGLHTFEFRGYDQNYVAATPYTLKLTVGERGFVYANDIFLPPTITVEPRGDYGLILYGYTVPYAEVDIQTDGNFLGTVVANKNGLYFIETALNQFEPGIHTATSFLKGTTRNLSSDTKSFTISSVFNSDEVQLEYTGEPLFDVLINKIYQEDNETRRIPFLPYIISFFGGAFMLWGITRVNFYQRRRYRFISHYEKK